MILIDDAGWGSLAGGVVIGACRKENPWTQHAFREVGVTFFQPPAYEQKLYLEETAKAVLDLLEELQTSEDEEVQICTGYILERARAAARAAGYKVVATRIKEPLQSLVEHEHLARVQALGIDVDLETITQKRGLYFWHVIRWLKGGDVDGQVVPEREAQCKTGWPTYHIWANHPYAKARMLSKKFQSRRKWQRRYGDEGEK